VAEALSREEAAASPSPDGGRDGVTVAAYRLAALGFSVLGAWVVWTAWGMTLYTEIGPGPGFFPFWAGLLLAGFAFVVLVQSFLGDIPRFEAPIYPPRNKIGSVLVTVGAVAFYALFVQRIGFAPTTFVMLLMLLTTFRTRLFPTALLVALAGSFGVGYVFQTWLGVVLPRAPGGVLYFIGM
jgi:putative tricarboxylic transport membrane protein